MDTRAALPPTLTDRDPVVIVGGGLEGALTALAVRRAEPDSAVKLIRQGDPLTSSLLLPLACDGWDAPTAALFEPMIVRQWSRAHIATSAGAELADFGLALLSVDQLIRELNDVLGDDYICDAHALTATRDHIWLSDDRSFAARRVHEISASAARSTFEVTDRVYQLKQDSDLADPVLLDATVRSAAGAVIQYFPLGGPLLLIRHVHASDGPAPAAPALMDRAMLLSELVTREPSSMEQRDAIRHAANGDFPASGKMDALRHLTSTWVVDAGHRAMAFAEGLRTES